VAVAIIKRFKQESMYGLSVKTKKETEVTVVERWSLVEICLYKFLPDIMIINIQEFIPKSWVNLMGHYPMTDCYLQLCTQNSHRGRQDQGRKCETMSLISFSSLIIVISSVELPYLSTATNWRLHANDKEMSGDESVSAGQTIFFF